MEQKRQTSLEFCKSTTSAKSLYTQENCFDEKSTSWGFPAMLPLSELENEDGRFLVDNKVMIFAEIDVFKVIGTLNETDKSQEASEILSKKKENVGANYFLKKTSPGKESNDANGTKQVDAALKSRKMKS